MGNRIPLALAFPVSPKPALECFWHSWLDWDFCFSVPFEGNSGKKPQSDDGDGINEFNRNDIVKQMLWIK